MRYLPQSKTFEHFLTRLNDAVIGEFGSDEPPRTDLLTAQIVGLPRSGTTVLYQLLARSESLGYPSNVMAMYWRAPFVGATIQARLAGSSPTLGLDSIAGRTTEPLGPHEFGYFWRNALGHSENCSIRDRTRLPAAELQRELDLINSAFNQPTVYKNFLAPFHLNYFEQELARQRFIFVARPPVDVACSLLNTRRKLGLSKEDAFGTRPATSDQSYADDTDVVIDQVSRLSSELDATQVQNSPNCYSIDYRKLCHATRTTIIELCDFLGLVPSTENLPETLAPSRPHLTLPKSDVIRIRSELG